MVYFPDSVQHTEATDRKFLTTAITNYLTQAGYRKSDIRVILKQMENLEWGFAYGAKFVNINFPGKKWANERSRITAAFSEYYQLCRQSFLKDVSK
jgi:hypothetical protein